MSKTKEEIESILTSLLDELLRCENEDGSIWGVRKWIGIKL